MNTLFTIGILLVVLGILIFIHEAGHFLAAKWAGVWVHRFALGLGSPIKWLTFTRDGTEYAICWVPLGGYVKMASREEEATTSALEGGATGVTVPPGMFYEDKPVWKRMVITLAGVTMNTVFAFVVFVGVSWHYGRLVHPETRVGSVDIEALPRGAEALRQVRPGDRITAVSGVRVSSWEDVMDRMLSGGGDDLAVTVNDSLTVLLRLHGDALEERARAFTALRPWVPAVVGTVESGSPADRAGVQPNDTIVALDSVPVHQFDEMVAVIRRNADQLVAVTLGGASGRRTVSITPTFIEGDTVTPKRGRIGVGVAELATSHSSFTFGQAVRYGARRTLDSSTELFRTVRGLITARISSRNLGGPILIGQMARQSFDLGWERFLGFLAVISINLAVLNLLPIPILDGGQAVFLLYEGIFRRPMPIRAREALMLVGLVLIVLLMLLANWNDIRRTFFPSW
jgi:regulator of sigma E protease